MDTKTINLIKKKQETLSKLKVFLKKEFIGLEEVIDSFVNSIEVWYIFPDLQIRPTIINLWGLTGVGKTDLVRKAISYLQFQDRFVEIEMNGNESTYKNIQTIMEESSVSSEDQCILFLDEFQKFRTVNEEGNVDNNNKSYSDVWSLLSDGRFPSQLKKKTDYLNEMLSYKYQDDYEKSYTHYGDLKEKKKEKKRIYKTDLHVARRIKKWFNLKDSIEDIMKYDDLKVYRIYEKFSKNTDIYEGELYKKLLIIVSGNLDEAYKIAKEVDEVDLDADFYNEYSKTITILDIKKSLTKRFRPEQIARLGNTHILYPSLNRKNYYEIIKLKCSQISDLIFSLKKVKISFDDSVYDTVYNNGVFPTQGVRPLMSTITNILSSVLPTFIYQCLLNDHEELNIRCEGNLMYGNFGKKSISIEIPTMLESIRQKVDRDTRYVVGVHEIGHAVVYVLLFQTLPAQICLNSTSSYKEGFIIPHPFLENKDNIYKNIMLLMAGRVAEEYVYGKENSITTGASADISSATEKAKLYVGKYGFSSFTGNITSSTSENENQIFEVEKSNKLSSDLISSAKEDTRNLLGKNINFYKEVLTFSLSNGKISPIQFKIICEKYKIPVKEVRTGEKLDLNYKGMTEKFLLKEEEVKTKKVLSESHPLFHSN